MTDADDPQSTLGPETVDDDSDTRGGLEPEAFQRELVVVTATVLILGIVGGSCLGMKIQRAERHNQAAQATHDESGESGASTEPQSTEPSGSTGSQPGR